MAPRIRSTPKAVRTVGLTFAVASALFAARDAPAHTLRARVFAFDTPLAAATREPRTASWAEQLEPIVFTNVHASADKRADVPLRLYEGDGTIDEQARAELERIASSDANPHELTERTEQLVFKAAYHFKSSRVTIVSAWRVNAGRHTTGDAIDFKLAGVSAAQLASYLRGLARVGVGVYTHPRTQFVHLDVREPSYHWIDASPPGVHWRERQLREPCAPCAVTRDAAWTPESDLPL